MIAVATPSRRPVPPSIHHASGSCTSRRHALNASFAAVKVSRSGAPEIAAWCSLVQSRYPDATSRVSEPTAIQSQFQT